MHLISYLTNFSVDHGLRAKPAEIVDVRKGFTLAQISNPELALHEWHELVARRQERAFDNNSWIVLEDERAYVHAMFFCELGRHADSASVLRISDVVAAELPGRSIADLTASCVDHLARQSGSRWVEFDNGAVCTTGLVDSIETRLRNQGWLLDAPKRYRFDMRVN